MNIPLYRVLGTITSLAVIGFATLAFFESGFEYHLSIYESYPAILWVCYYTAIVGSILLIFGSALFGGPGWKYGTVLLFSNYAIFYSLIHLQGYAVYGASGSDVFIHLDIIQNILQTGSFTDSLSGGNWYPGLHILGGSFVLVTDIELLRLQAIFALLFSMLYVLGLFLYTRRMTGHRGKSLFVFGVGAPLILGEHQLTIHPAVISFMLIPLFLLVLEQYRRISSKRVHVSCILLVFTSFFVLFHPLTTVYLLVLVSCILVVQVALSRSDHTQNMLARSRDISSGRRAYLLPLLMATLFLAWHSSIDRSAHIIAGRVVNVLNPAATSGDGDGAGGSRESLLEHYVGGLFNGNYSFGQIVEIWIIGEFGALFIYVFLGLGAFFVFVRLRRYTTDELFSIVLLGVAALFTTVMVFVLRNPFRLARFTLLFLCVFVGVVFGRYAATTDRSAETGSDQRNGSIRLFADFNPTYGLAIGFVVILVISASVLAGSNVYQDNRNMPHSTIEGTDWVVDNIDENSNMNTTISSKLAIYSTEPDTGHGGMFPVVDSRSNVPQNLGYNDSDTATETFENETYVVTRVEDTTWHHSFPEQRWSSINYYTETDLDTARDDRTLNQLYTNDRYDVWQVEN